MPVLDVRATVKVVRFPRTRFILLDFFDRNRGENLPNYCQFARFVVWHINFELKMLIMSIIKMPFILKVM
jgi:hypothetical protein